MTRYPRRSGVSVIVLVFLRGRSPNLRHILVRTASTLLASFALLLQPSFMLLFSFPSLGLRHSFKLFVQLLDILQKLSNLCLPRQMNPIMSAKCFQLPDTNFFTWNQPKRSLRLQNRSCVVQAREMHIQTRENMSIEKVLFGTRLTLPSGLQAT